MIQRGDICWADLDSVANVTAVITLDRADLDEPVNQLPEALMRDVDQGLRKVLGL